LFAILVGLTAISLVASCGDDDGDDRLTEEEYFAEVETLNRDLDQAFEEEVFRAETAKQSVDAFLAAAEDVQNGLADLEPPEDLEDAHQAYVDGVNDVVEYLEGLSEETPEDAPSVELESILGSDEEAFASVGEAECNLVDIAEERDIALEFLTCDEEESGEEGDGTDAGDTPVAVEATEFEFAIDGEFTSETTGIVFTNAGEQPHELRVEQLIELGGVTAPTADEIVEAVRENGEYPEGTNSIANTGAGPGEEGALAFEEPLAPGRYVLVCFVPDEESDEPHAALGMVAEFTVE
jgi:hypothetical protein